LVDEALSVSVDIVVLLPLRDYVVIMHAGIPDILFGIIVASAPHAVNNLRSVRIRNR